MRSKFAGALLSASFLAIACGGNEPSGGGSNNNKVAETPKEDPAEIARREAEAEAKRKAAREKMVAERDELKTKVAELQKKRDSLSSKHEAELAGMPEPMKLRRVVSRLVQDSVRKRSLYETDLARIEELEKAVNASASAEIKALEKQIADKEREFNRILTGAKAERENERLGVVEETEVQKEIRTLRAAKKRWFAATREARRGVASARPGANRDFKSWFGEDAQRKAVVTKAVPEGKSVDSYDFSELLFFLHMEKLEDKLERLNVQEEKETLSENEIKLVAIENEIDKLKESLAEKMSAGGGDLEEYTALKEELPSKKRAAEGLERQLAGMRESFNEVDKIRERQAKEVEDLDIELENAEKKLRKLNSKLR